MLGMEKRVESLRQMWGEAPSEELLDKAAPAKSGVTTAVMLALVGILAAVAVYVVLDSRYTAKSLAYESRLASMDRRVAEAVAAPKDIARRLIVANTLTEISAKVDQLKGNMDPAYQERLGRIDEMVKGMQQDMK